MAALTRALLFGLGLLIAASAPGAARLDENALRAALVYNIMLFVEWPALSEPDIVVCVVSEDIELQRAFGALAAKTVQGREVRVSRRGPLALIEGCGVAYFQGIEDELITTKVRSVAGRPVLTVGGSPGVGAMVEFALSGERLVFDIRAGDLEASGLRISSRVMQLARTVIGR